MSFTHLPQRVSWSGVSNPWIFLKDVLEKHDKLWTPKGLVLPKDLGFSY